MFLSMSYCQTILTRCLTLFSSSRILASFSIKILFSFDVLGPFIHSGKVQNMNDQKPCKTVQGVILFLYRLGQHYCSSLKASQEKLIA